MELSLSEQAALGNGADFWSTKRIGDVPSISVTDGPHGLRKQENSADHLGIGGSVKATCFPPAVGLSQSWNSELAREIGVALGEECQTAGVGVLLGPGINIKRDPRGGRNFEYFSEDPHLTGLLGAAWVSGLQSVGVGASLKHFAANNSENDRMRASSDIDDRPMREIYLRAFQKVVQETQPWTVMCSYNRINGVYAAENHWLLTTVLRDEWGFDGCVISDWGAVDDRVAAVAAGLDLAMPGGDSDGDAAVVAAVENGILPRDAVQRSADAVAALAHRAHAARRSDAGYDADEHHALARRAAGQGLVLLKNDGDLLPLRPSGRIAIVGEFALKPRYQGGGSSHVDSSRVDIPFDEIRAAAPEARVEYAAGFTTTDPATSGTDREQAVRLAAGADVAVVFVGLQEGQESEGYDRDDIELPAEQIKLVRDVTAAQPRTIVIVSHGGVLRLEPILAAPAILDAALLGQAVGGAIADVLFGTVNPSGRLAETVPVRIQDAPSFLEFDGHNSRIRYGEGIFVGYRWYDARELDVTFPFGHGLSYTSFDYADLELSADASGITAHLTLTNTGQRDGREVVQLYVSAPAAVKVRAARELKAFTSVHLRAGESRTVTLTVSRQDLASWDTRIDSWLTTGGDYTVAVGASSRDLRLTGSIPVAGDTITIPLTLNSTVGEVFANPVAGPLLQAKMAEIMGGDGGEAAAHEGIDVVRLISAIPIGRMSSGPAQLPRDFIADLLAAGNRSA